MKTKNNSVKHSGPGRPAYKPKFPAKLRWTMTDFQIRNGVDPETGKGEHCSKLTLVKFLARELANRRSGLVIKLKGETAAPSSDSGLGRKAFLHCLRSRVNELDEKTPKTKKLATARKSTVSVKLAPTPSYEDTKAALGLDKPAPTPVAAAPVAPEPVVTAPAPTEPVTTEAPAEAGTVAAV